MEVKKDTRSDITCVLPLKPVQPLLTRLDNDGVAGATALSILRGLSAIVSNNLTGVAGVRLIVRSAANGEVHGAIQLNTEGHLRPSELLGRKLSTIGFSDRVTSLFSKAGLETLGDLCTKSEYDLLRYRNFSRGCLEEVTKKLAVLGLSLKVEK